jgi:hypothetical protein
MDGHPSALPSGGQAAPFLEPPNNGDDGANDGSNDDDSSDGNDGSTTVSPPPSVSGNAPVTTLVRTQPHNEMQKPTTE